MAQEEKKYDVKRKTYFLIFSLCLWGMVVMLFSLHSFCLANTVDTSVTVPGSDTTPPSRSSGSPSGILAAGTTGTTLSLTTDENATCKYGTSAGIACGSIANTFTTTGGTSHSAGLTGLSNNHSYVYYVRCQDTASNANIDDYQISFSVAAAQGGGGGGGYLPPATTDTSASISNLQQQVNLLIAQLESLILQAMARGIAVPADLQTRVRAAYFYSFTRDLRFGMNGEDIKQLQIYLNTHGFTVSTTGFGSSGNETIHFGPATQAALIKFQKASGISPAAGYFGPKTRGYIGLHP